MIQRKIKMHTNLIEYREFEKELVRIEAVIKMTEHMIAGGLGNE